MYGLNLCNLEGYNTVVYLIRFEMHGGFEATYVGELAHGIGFDGDVVLLELLLDFIDARRDVLGLRDVRKSGTNDRHQIRFGLTG